MDDVIHASSKRYNEVVIYWRHSPTVDTCELSLRRGNLFNSSSNHEIAALR